MDFAYSLKQKLFSYEVLLRMERGREGGGAGGYIILESVVSGIEEKANSVWIFYHKKKKIVFLVVLVSVTVSTHLYTCPLSKFNLS